MSLATRCSACGTVFRVVQDQLKVSEGWVRCGRCNEVFNALEGLFDLDREAPADWEPAERADWTREAQKGAPPAELEPPRPESDPELVHRIDSELFGDSRKPDQKAMDASAAPPDPELPARADDQPVDGVDAEIGSRVEPGFLRQAEREERWRRPMVRAALAGVAGVLSGALALQILHHFRHDVATRSTEWSAAVTRWCAIAGCTVDAPRHIDAIAVESTALSRVGTTDAYRLGIVLRNHDRATVALPSIDLALTDASGQLIARRTLTGSDFGAAATRIPANGEVSLQAAISAGATRITGYTVEAFYP